MSTQPFPNPQGVLANLCIFGGETPLLSFGPTLDNNGQPVDLTGAVISFVFYNGGSAYAPIQFSKTVGNGITIPTQTGANIGVFTVQLLSTDTQNLAGQYYYQCAVTLDGISLISTYGYFQVDACQAL
jgi:hypothetical protein